MRLQSSRWQKSLGLAAALHVTLVLLAAHVQLEAPVQPPPAADRGDAIWLELVTREEPPAAHPVQPPPARVQPPELPRPPVAPGALAARTPAPLPTNADASPAASHPTPSALVPSEPAPPGVAPPGADGSEPRLSLRDLGVGVENNLFLGPAASPPSQGQVLNRRLRHSLSSGLARHDQRVGLGPEGPAIAAVKSIVLQSATTPNTSAVLRLRTDGEGRTVLVELIDASNESDGWQRIAAELERALAGKRLRVPRGTGGVSLTLRVASRVQLPSGADPGLAVDLFGQTIKKGEGDRSAKLKILTPEISVQEVEIPNTDGVKIPVLTAGLTLIGGVGDLVDIGAVAQRVVTAYLVGMETHPAP